MVILNLNTVCTTFTTRVRGCIFSYEGWPAEIVAALQLTKVDIQVGITYTQN